MMRDDVLAQLMESVYLLEMVEDLLTTSGAGQTSDSVLRGLRITVRNVREGLTESFGWVASVEEEQTEEHATSVLDEGALRDEEALDDEESEHGAVVGTVEEPVKQAHREALAGEEKNVSLGRSILESILRPAPNPAEVMKHRRQASSPSGRWLRDGEVETFSRLQPGTEFVFDSVDSEKTPNSAAKNHPQ